MLFVRAQKLGRVVRGSAALLRHALLGLLIWAALPAAANAGASDTMATAMATCQATKSLYAGPHYCAPGMGMMEGRPQLYAFLHPAGNPRGHIAAWSFGCPSGESWNQALRRCMQPEIPPVCPLGGLVDPDTGQCGAPKCDDNCPVAGGNGSNPIDSATGNKRQVELDYVGSGVFPLRFERTYNSHRTIEADPLPIGVGWSHSYQSRLLLLSDGNSVYRIFAYRPNGAVQSFIYDGSSWAGDADVRGRLDVKWVGSSMSSITYTRADDTVEAYNQNGRLLSITRRDGYSQVLSYSFICGWLCLDKVSDPQGRSLVFSYDDGKLSTVTDPTGRVIRYTYANGNLTSVGYPEGVSGTAVRRYHYDEPGQTGGYSQPHALTGITDESDQRYASWAYDGYRRGVLSVHGAYVEGTADRTAFSFNGDGTTTITDSLGKTRKYSFAVQHRVARLSSLDALCPSCGNTAMAKTYDVNGMPDLSVDFSGTVTDHDYNERLLEVQRIEAATDVTGSTRTIQTDWHATFRLPVERRTFDSTNTLVSTSSWTYNARGQVLGATQTDPATGVSRVNSSTYCESGDVSVGVCPMVGLLIRVDGARTDLADVTSYTYYPSDDVGCATNLGACKHRRGDLWKVTNAIGQTAEVLSYDRAGRVLSTKDANGVVTDLDYGPRGWLTARKIRGLDDSGEADDEISRISYFRNGLVERITRPDGSYISYSYDAARRLTGVRDAVGNAIEYTLDDAGNRLREDTKDATGVVRRSLSRIYNEFGLLQAAKDAYGNTTEFAQDANGDVVESKDPLGRTVTRDYDPLRRLVRTLQDVEGIGAVSKFTYDALDNITKVADPGGLETRYELNGLGDLLQLKSPDTGASSYSYDSSGNRKVKVDARGVLADYRYDALGRILGIAYPDSSLDVHFSYDVVNSVCGAVESFAVGRLAKVIDGASVTEYCYDRFGNKTRKVQHVGGSVMALRYSYADGLLRSAEYPDGLVVDYVRDPVGQVAEIGGLWPGQVRQVLITRVTYAPFGPPTGWIYGNNRHLLRAVNLNYQPETIRDGSLGGLSLRYTFDAVGRLELLEKGDQSALLARYGYDALGRLVVTKDGPTGVPIESYGYDAAGNRTSLTTAAGNEGYLYAPESHRLLEVGGQARAYDAAGNTIRVGAREFSYSDANRVSSVKHADVPIESYRYNYRGERVLRVPQLGSAQVTLYDESGHWLGNYNANGQPDQQAIWLGDYPIAMTSAHGTGFPDLAYIQPDHLGAPRVVIDSVRNVSIWEWSNEGEAFGNQIPNEDPDGDGTTFSLTLRFPGQQATEGTGMFYNYLRDYDPAIGRYAQSDPIGLSGGINTYSYVGGDPASFIDPLGLLRYHSWVQRKYPDTVAYLDGLKGRMTPRKYAGFEYFGKIGRKHLDEVLDACSGPVITPKYMRHDHGSYLPRSGEIFILESYFDRFEAGDRGREFLDQFDRTVEHELVHFGESFWNRNRYQGEEGWGYEKFVYDDSIAK